MREPTPLKPNQDKNNLPGTGSRAKTSKKKEAQKGMENDEIDNLRRPLFKNKPIAKAKGYSEFYKFKYVELKSMHPSWSMGQISTIINLQWRHEKMMRRPKKHRIFGKGPRNGLEALRKRLGVNTVESHLMWRRFPLETKMRWRLRSQQG